MKRYILFLCLFNFAQSFAQKTFVEVINIEPGINYPTDMPVIEQWITNALGTTWPHTVYELWGFDTFPIGDRKPMSIVFPNTDGIRITIKNDPVKNKDHDFYSSPMYVQANLPILDRYRTFNPSKLTYSASEYFDIATRDHSISFELVNAALNIMPRKPKKDQALVFIDSINSFYKTTISYPEKKTIESLIDILEKNKFKKNIFYDMFVKADSSEESIKKLNKFFKWVYPFTEDITKQIDDLRILSVTIGMNPGETLEIPATIARVEGKDGPLHYPCRLIEANLNYKIKQLTIKIKDRYPQPPITLVNALKSRVSKVQTSKGMTTTQEWLPIKNEAIVVDEFIIEVTENTVTVSVHGNAAIYKLLENSNKL